MFKKAGVLFLYTETPLHPGSGTSVGAVDLPIQRERHTGYPIIQASGVKGALRDLAEAIFGLSEDDTDDRIEAVFGPKKEPEKHAGALSFTDARILLFPVRSLAGVFAWITCPGVIERFKRDMEFLRIHKEGKANPLALEELNKISLPELDRGEASVPEGAEVIVRKDDSERIILEDMSFSLPSDDKAKREEVANLAKWLAKNALSEDLGYWREKLKKDLVVLHNDVFKDFVQFSTEVITRIKIGKTGTVETGPWDEENLPSETLLYSLALATDPRVPKEERDKLQDNLKDAQGVLNFLASEVIAKAHRVQFGGDETVGRGIVSAVFLQGENLKSISKGDDNG